MTSEESIEKEPTPEEIRRSRLQAIILGSCLVVALVSLVFAYVSRTALNKANNEVLELQHQVLQDSLLEAGNKELQKQLDRAEQNLKKALEKPKPKPKEKDTPKKNKPKKK